MFQKISITLFCFISSFCLLGQTITDENGNKVYNGSSIAIFTRLHCYERLHTGDLIEVKSDELSEELRVGMNVMATSAAQNHGIRTVNRDDKTFKEVQAWIDETKNEDYLDGISVKAKKIGATHILIQDIRMYKENAFDATFKISLEVIGVQTNIESKVCHTYHLGHFGISPTDMIDKEKNTLREFFMSAFPVFFVLQKTHGKYAYLFATSAFGIDTYDKVYFYKWNNYTGVVQGNNISFCRMEQLAVGTRPMLDNGLLKVKLDRPIADANDLVIKLGAIDHSEINTYQHIPLSVMDIRLSGNTFDDYCKKEINDALYNVLYNYPAFNVIASENLSLVKTEREYQKSEDFIDGETIEQFKASGARYILTLTDYSRIENKINFRLNFVNVENSAIENSQCINCQLDEIESALYSAIRKILVSPIAIDNITNNKMSVYSCIPICTTKGERVELLYNKPIINPTKGTTSYNRIKIATGNLLEWNCQEYIIDFDSIDDKSEFNNIHKTKNNGLYYLANSSPE